MKRCPECHSVSQDDATTCDACGTNLADVPFESMDEIDRDQMADEKKDAETERRAYARLKRRMILGAMIVIVFGVSAIILGIYLISNGSNSYGFVSLIAGMVILFIFLGLAPMGLRRYRAGVWVATRSR